MDTDKKRQHPCESVCIHGKKFAHGFHRQLQALERQRLLEAKPTPAGARIHPERLPRRPIAGETAARALRQWLREERLAWREVLRLDPLLPRCLHPAGYSGVNAWQRRLGIMAEAGRCLRSFRLPA